VAPFLTPWQASLSPLVLLLYTTRFGLFPHGGRAPPLVLPRSLQRGRGRTDDFRATRVSDPSPPLPYGACVRRLYGDPPAHQRQRAGGGGHVPEKRDRHPWVRPSAA